jgi:hypothetical protein
MKRVLMTSRSRRILACILLTLFLHAGSFVPCDAARATTTSTPNSKLIRIWIVGSPHTNELPPAVIPSELRQRAESIGYTIEIEAFRPSGFAAHFHQALQNHHEPEILTFDNYGVIIGMQTRMGVFQGIDWDRRTASSLALVHETMSSLQPRGWVMLVPSAVNYEAARALAMRPPECDSLPGNPAIISPALRQAQEKAVLATRAYLDCDRSTLARVSDKSRLVQQCFQPQSDTKTESVKACSVAGNDKLAFVTLVSGFSAVVRDPRSHVISKQGMDLGQKSILAVLTNQSGTWQLLAITHDPMNTVGRVRETTNSLAYSLDHGPSIEITIEPARLLTPNGVYPVPQLGERFGDFIWHPSQSTDVIGQVVEFMWGKDTNWGLTRLFFLPASENKLSSGLLMSGGPMVWRVWSINKYGDLVFSETHSFRDCPVPAVCR